MVVLKLNAGRITPAERFNDRTWPENVTSEGPMPILTRRHVLAGAAVGIASLSGAAYWMLRTPEVPIGYVVTEDELTRATALLSRHMAIDVHAHPGRTFVAGAEHLPLLLKIYAMQGTFEESAVGDMVAGHLTGSTFATVADFQTLDFGDNGLSSTRAFGAGEAWASHKKQISHLRALVDQGLVYPINSPADFAAARAAGKVGALIVVEGGDFLEGNPERVAEAFADGVRIITLMHYRNNELGSSITEMQATDGLSIAGAAVVREMNRVGMIIDVAHSSVATAYEVLECSTKPVIASHVQIHGSATHPRFIPVALAKAIADKRLARGYWNIDLVRLCGPDTRVDRSISDFHRGPPTSYWQVRYLIHQPR